MPEQELDLTLPSSLHLVSAFLAMEPPDFLISLARVCGGGTITERVQRFIWDHCISESDGKCQGPYLKSFLKKLIVGVEQEGADVLDELYEKYAFFMASLKDIELAKGNSRVLKSISFLFPDDCLQILSCPKSMKLVVPLYSSLNMLAGDTGCSIWPSSLFLSEFILSCPGIFSNKACFEVGSGVGLVGVCLAHVKASKVILSDGDLSSLANMKLNLELNQRSNRTDFLERNVELQNLVQCIYLPWESALNIEVEDFMPDIILGADVIYDPLCIPHLIRVLSDLLGREKLLSRHQNDLCSDCQLGSRHIKGGVCGADYACGLDGRKTHHNDQLKNSNHDNRHVFDAGPGKAKFHGDPDAEYPCNASTEGPIAYIASVIRNIDTFNCFLALAEHANFVVTDITEKVKLFDLLPYMQSYNRSSIRLFTVVSLCK